MIFLKLQIVFCTASLFAGLPANCQTDNTANNFAARSGYRSESSITVPQNEREPDPVFPTSNAASLSGNTMMVTTLAGSYHTMGNLNGLGAIASFNQPTGIAVDANGNIYVADAANNEIRKITPGGAVTTIAGNGKPGRKDGFGKEASFYYPTGIATDAAGNLYVADKGNHLIRKISPAGVVSTLAGSGLRGYIDGMGEAASFDKPVSVALDGAGNLFVADQCNHAIRKISMQGQVSTLAGSGKPGSKDGSGQEASFYNPSGVVVDKTGNVYVADYDNNRIRKITASGSVSTIAGSDAFGKTDGLATEASFFYPDALTIDGAGNLFIADQVNQLIRKMTPAGEVTTIAGSGVTGHLDSAASKASFNYPSGIAVDGFGNMYVADRSNHSIRKINLPVNTSQQGAGRNDNTNPIAAGKVSDPARIEKEKSTWQ